MKRLCALLLCSVLLISSIPVSASAAGGSINVYNWGQYISDGSDGYIDVNKAFTEKTGIQVNYMTFDSNESMYTKLKTGGSTYDVIIPSDYMIAKLISEGMLEKLDYSNIPNYRYNSKYVDEEDVGSWDLLWNPKYSGKILMFDNPRDAFAIGELKLGYSLNTEDKDDLRNASYELIQQKPLVQAYVMDQIFDKMEREEAWIAPYYAGDYLLMAEENPDLKFFFPEEGFNLFIDACCIPKGCQNKEGAEAYINFLCSPEISGENLDYLGYSTPISKAKDFMDPDISASDIAYPTEETLANGQSFLNLSVEANHEMDALWLQVKTQSGVDSYAVWSMIALVVLLIAYLIFRQIRRKRRIAARCARWKTDSRD